MRHQPRTNLTLHFDGGCSRNPGGEMSFGWHLDDSDTGVRIAEWGGPIHGYPTEERTNNTAEFTALLCGLEWVAACKDRLIDTLTVLGDSKLVVEVVNRKWKAKKPHLKTLRDQCLDVLRRIDAGDIVLEWVPREENSEADRLADV